MFSFSLNSTDLKKVVWTFLEAFAIAFWATAQGWSALPSFTAAKALVISSLLAGGAAAISLVKNLVLADNSTLK